MKRLTLLLALGGPAPALAQHGGEPGQSAAMAAPPVAPPPAAAPAAPAQAAGKIVLDRLEYQGRRGPDGFAWDAHGWYGGGRDKLWLKSDGDGTFGEGVERVEVQALWSRTIDRWFDLQLGLRHDFGHGPDRSYLAIGVQGFAPYWFELDAAAFVSEKGDVSARIGTEHDLLISQKLILQPSAEVEFSLRDVPELGIGSGLSGAEAGLRLRYEFRPDLAPYVGVEYERGFGGTARFRRAAGEEAGGWNAVAGLGLRF